MSFGRLEKPTGHKPMSEINVTPLVDVMLVLLVIFIITVLLMASRLALNLPQVESAAAKPDVANAASVAIGLDASGQIFWGDEAVDSATLGQRLRGAAAGVETLDGTGAASGRQKALRGLLGTLDDRGAGGHALVSQGS